VIGLHVSLDDVTHAHVFLRRRFQIGLDVVLWIHHSAAGCAASAEQVAGAAGLRREEMPEDHATPPALLSYGGNAYRVQSIVQIAAVEKHL
jgi:hypothetical protein